MLSWVCTLAQTTYNTYTLEDTWWQPDAGNNSKSFVKIPVAENGIYRVGYSELVSVGFTFSTPSSIQLFRRGIEQAIFIQDNGDGFNAANDYIEFYGEKNDGKLDKELYFPQSHHPHEYHSLFNDTATYFLGSSSGAVGKRVAGFSSTTGTNQTFYTYKDLRLFTSEYMLGKNYGEVRVPFYDQGEGWFSNNMGTGNALTVPFQNITNAVNTPNPAYQPKLRVLVVGVGLSLTNPRYHEASIQVNSGSGFTQVASFIFYGQSIVDTTIALNFSNVNAGGTLDVKIEVISPAGNSFSVGLVELSYARGYTLTGSKNYLTLPDGAVGSTSTISLSGAPSNAIAYMVDSLGNHRRTVQSSSNFSLHIPHATARPELYISSTSDIISLLSNQLKLVSIARPSTTAEYIIITGKQFQNAAQDYASYRQSLNGGNFTTGVFYIEDIFNIFSYGDFTPVAIRRFCDYLMSNGDNANYLFLVGKGLSSEHYQNTYGYYRYNQDIATMVRNGQNLKNFNIIPTPGNPGGDVFFSTHIDNPSTWVPEIPTGRLTAVFEQEVYDYLDKVKEFEGLENDLSKKRILHLGGGNSQSQINDFMQYLNTWKRVAEGPLFGGYVQSIFKQSANLVNITVEDQVNEGLGLITFFGHSTLNQTDIDIGRVSDPTKNYNNSNGQYPLILLNGCQSGNIFRHNMGFGEDWVLTPGKGAIGFIASSTNALSLSAKNYTDHFYRTAFQDSAHINSRIGDIMKETIKDIGVTSSGGNSTLAHTLNYNLLGDPALRMFGEEKPDLETNDLAVFLQPINGVAVTALSDSFNVGIVVRNFGNYSLSDSFYVSVDRTFPSGVHMQYAPKMYKAIPYSDTIYFGISSKSSATYGLNTFRITLDYNHTTGLRKIEELDENNNEAIIQVVIPLSGVLPIFPKEFDIVGPNTAEYKNPWKLIAQSAELLTENLNYEFQIDTTPRFDGIMRSAIVTGSSIATWENIPLTSMLNQISAGSGGGIVDSIVFYWRVRFERDNDQQWGNSSFHYNNFSPGGWAQSHFYQFKRDEFKTIGLNDTSRLWEFDKVSVDFKMVTAGPDYTNSNSIIEYGFPSFTPDNINEGYVLTSGNNRYDGFLCMIIDGETLQPKLIPPTHPLAPTLNNHRKGNTSYYFSMLNATHMSVFNDFIDAVDAGDYVGVLTRRVTDYASWMPSLGVSMSKIGAQMFPPNDTTGYALLGRKGSATPLVESYVYDANLFDTTVILENNIQFGNIYSTIIGPATKWGKLYRNIALPNVGDEWSIDIVGLDNFKQEKAMLGTNVLPNGYDLSSINNDSFPYIKLQIKKEDYVEVTPPQMKNWMVTYEQKIPEGIIVGNPNNYVNKTYYEGQTATYTFDFKNISQYPFKDDSLVVVATIVSPNGNSIPTQFKIKQPAPDETIEFSYELNTKGMEGGYFLQIMVNPFIQLEHYYQNNSLSVPYDVIRDDVHPILDVTFDGVHIMDYDIVSPTPEIVVRMRDDNKFLKKNIDSLPEIDQILIKYPGINGLYSDNILNDPSKYTINEKNGDVEIKYRPDFSAYGDGEFALLVQMSDEVGNISGVKPYEIHFTVINKTTMTNFFPYPNPFSTSMRFAYTLTGREQPDKLKIQIMTISGKIVREITRDELGHLRIGKHLTDFVWDGTDEFGNRLGNGVYLYRVMSELGGEQIEHRTAGSTNGKSSAADELFTKGWGKIYILR